MAGQLGTRGQGKCVSTGPIEDLGDLATDVIVCGCYQPVADRGGVGVASIGGVWERHSGERASMGLTWRRSSSNDMLCRLLGGIKAKAPRRTRLCEPCSPKSGVERAASRVNPTLISLTHAK